MDRDPGHRPVLRQEVVQMLVRPGAKVFVDCTLGAGGHAEALLQNAGEDARLIGIDVDEANLALAKRRLAPFAGRIRLFKANFSHIQEVLEEAQIPSADAVLADLGISSTQLDDPARGLSFQADAPLDMRLDADLERTAADLVNKLEEQQLADLIYQYGEERYSRRIATAIVLARQSRRLERTGELARLVQSAYPAPARHSRRGVHPATRTFQALRIAVNDEMGSLEKLLAALPGVLGTGGRAAIISFHSLEDRRVKHAFADWAQTRTAELLTKKPITPTEQETQDNPRSRSAKLRGIRRVA